MNNPLKSEVDNIVTEVKSNPVHIIRWLAKEEELKKTPELFIKHRSFYTEDFVFEPDEDIMVYADFNYPLPQLRPGEPPEFARYPLHSHEFFELFYVYSGSCTCLYGGEAHVISPGSVWIFNTRCRHKLINSADGLVFNVMVRRSTFTADMLGMMRGNDLFMNFFLNSLSAEADSPSYMSFELIPGEAAEQYLFSIICEYHKKRSCYQGIMKLLYSALMVELSRKYRSGVQLSDSSGRASGIIAYISDHWNDITLQKLANEFHYSPAYISRILLRSTGMNFSDYVRHFRLERAEYLLTHTQLSIDQIAELMGYSQRSSFEKEFKKFSGRTPSRCRREVNSKL